VGAATGRATAHVCFCAPPVEQPACRSEPPQGILADFVNAFPTKASMLRFHQASMVRLYDCGERRRATEIIASLGDCMEIGNMAGELVYEGCPQPAGLSEGVEQ
jgi:hypothetical protein